MNTVEAVEISGGNLHVGNNNTNIINNVSGPQPKRCLRTLQPLDPRSNRPRIEQTKGGLLGECCDWIFEHSDFRRWLNSDDQKLFWVKGGAGKGKTMLLCGVSRELEGRLQMSNNQKRSYEEAFKSSETSPLILYFFCQGTDARLSNGLSILKGLIYHLVCLQPSVLPYLQDEYETSEEQLFTGPHSFYNLERIFNKMLSHNSSQTIFIIIDALDECENEQDTILAFIKNGQNEHPHVKWLISARYHRDIEQALYPLDSKIILSLDLNSDCVDEAIRFFINHKIDSLLSIKYDHNLREEARMRLHEKAGGTFLWVSLVTDKLHRVSHCDVQDVLNQVPSTLAGVYQYMLDKLQDKDKSQDKSLKAVEQSRSIIAITTLAYVPLRLTELASLCRMAVKSPSDIELIRHLVEECSSFLTIREDRVYLIHQSAKDFLLREGRDIIFPDKPSHTHYRMVEASLTGMSNVLHYDIYSLGSPGTSTYNIQIPDHNPLLNVQYSCIFWADHLLESECPSASETEDFILNFLRKQGLYWIEAVGLLKSLPVAFEAMTALAEKFYSTNLVAFFDDIRRFLGTFGSLIRDSPLQVYYSAMVFSPTKSLIRTCYCDGIGRYVTMLPKPESNWDNCIETLEHGYIRAAAVSSDKSNIVISLDNSCVHLHNLITRSRTRVSLDTSHNTNSSSDFTRMRAFSSDNRLLVSISLDDYIRLYEITSKSEAAIIYTLKHKPFIRSVSVSINGLIAIVQGHRSGWIHHIYTTRSSEPIWTYKSQGYIGCEVIGFSNDGAVFVFSTRPKVFDVVDTTLRSLTTPFKQCDTMPISLCFSADDVLFAVGYKMSSIHIFDKGSRSRLYSLKTSGAVTSLEFSKSCDQLAFGQINGLVNIWNRLDETIIYCSKHHSLNVSLVSFLPHGLLSMETAGPIKIFKTFVEQQSQSDTKHDHEQMIKEISFSQDYRLVASMSARIIKLWDALDLKCLATFKGFFVLAQSIVFSSDGKLLAFEDDKLIIVWDTYDNCRRCTIDLKSEEAAISLTFSPDSRYLGSITPITYIIYEFSTSTVFRIPRLRDYNRHLPRFFVFSNNSQRFAIYQNQWELSVRDVNNPEHSLMVVTPFKQNLASFDTETNIYTTWDNSERDIRIKNRKQIVMKISNDGTIIESSIMRPQSNTYRYERGSHWIEASDGERIIKLPADYKVSSWAGSNSSIAFGTESGSIIVIYIHPDQLMEKAPQRAVISSM